ncbi:MAG: hypothetical protein M1819_000813 [Sarea resinae]|nr:MAG: hypothetical protein M1819_000813 [Sarea resinae]
MPRSGSVTTSWLERSVEDPGRYTRIFAMSTTFSAKSITDNGYQWQHQPAVGARVDHFALQRWPCDSGESLEFYEQNFINNEELFTAVVSMFSCPELFTIRPSRRNPNYAYWLLPPRSKAPTCLSAVLVQFWGNGSLVRFLKHAPASTTNNGNWYFMKLGELDDSVEFEDVEFPFGGISIIDIERIGLVIFNGEALNFGFGIPDFTTQTNKLEFDADQQKRVMALVGTGPIGMHVKFRK